MTALTIVFASNCGCDRNKIESFVIHFQTVEYLLLLLFHDRQEKFYYQWSFGINPMVI
jgi:hypothetical protein